jgi:hypothetical protein
MKYCISYLFLLSLILFVHYPPLVVSGRDDYASPHAIRGGRGVGGLEENEGNNNNYKMKNIKESEGIVSANAGEQVLRQLQSQGGGGVVDKEGGAYGACQTVGSCILCADSEMVIK